jgi:hypothetical protein
METTFLVASDAYDPTWLGGTTGMNAPWEGEEVDTITAPAGGRAITVPDIVLAKRTSTLEITLTGVPQDVETGAWCEAVNAETQEVQGGGSIFTEDGRIILTDVPPGVYYTFCEVWTVDEEGGEALGGAETVVAVGEAERAKVALEVESRGGQDWYDTTFGITGKVAVGETLTAAIVEDSYAEEMGIEWTSLDTTWVIDGKIRATGEALTLTADDLDKSISAVVLARQNEGWPAVGIVKAGATVGIGAPPFPTRAVFMSTTTPQVGKAVGIESLAWSTTPSKTTYQWMADDKPIPGASSSTYAPDTHYVGALLSVRITAEVRGLKPASFVVAARNKVTAGDGVQAAFKLPTTAAAGQVLTGPAAPATWKATYAWLRNGVPIAGATGASYKIQDVDGGTSIRVKVTLSKYGYTSSTATSERVDILKGTLKKVKIKVKGKATVGKKIKATFTPKRTGYKAKVQWWLDGKAIKGKAAKKASYKVKASQAGHNLRARVTITKPGFKSKKYWSKVLTATK